MKLTFHGGIGSVTGANYLLESGGTKILIDCGLFQGGHYAERKNFEPFPYDPKGIKAVFITHSHLDHIGRIPKLYKDGFRGSIYSTAACKDFSELLLLDSHHILAREAEREKRPPICEVEDVNEAMKLWKKRDYHELIEEGPFRVKLYDAGHILGSAVVEVEGPASVIPSVSEESRGDQRDPSAGSRPSPNATAGAAGRRIRVVFSGDLGNSPAPIIKPTERIESADYCVIESTYGDRLHGNIDRRRDELEDVIEDTVRRGGTLIIPTFAMERTQELLYHLNQLFEEGRIPRVPVFMDSPLAIKLTAVYKKYEGYFNKETAAIAHSGEDILNFSDLHLTLTTAQSKRINDVSPPKIVIAGSGMSQGGRILHHERRYLPDPKSTILFVGYQAKNSLGRMILEGAGEVTIFGEKVPVRCKRVNIAGYSAHADQAQLLGWLNPMRRSLKRVFVVQGEAGASEALARKIRDELAVSADTPEAGRSVEL